MRLKDKVALVTGGASGIGEAISRTLAREGARVAIVDLNLKGAQRVASQITSQGGQATTVRCDVSKLGEVETAVKQVLGQYQHVDILVNDAGYWVTKRFLDTTPEDWERTVHVCYFGVLNFCKVLLPHMMERRGGKVINVSSRSAQVGNIMNSVYTGAKGAIDAFTKSMAKDMGPYNITVNCVAPGLVETPATEGGYLRENLAETLKEYPLGRIGMPQDIANGVLFLASEEANFISGVVLTVAGGGTCR